MFWLIIMVSFSHYRNLVLHYISCSSRGAARVLLGLALTPSSFSDFSSSAEFVAALFCPLVVLCDRLPLFCCSALSSFVGVPRFPRPRGTDVDDSDVSSIDVCSSSTLLSSMLSSCKEFSISLSSFVGVPRFPR